MRHSTPFTAIEIQDPLYGTLRERHDTLGAEALPTHQGIQYSSPSDVPVPVRHMLRYAHASGVTIKNLSIIYDNIPQDWIRLFAAPANLTPY